jgi:FdhD protein
MRHSVAVTMRTPGEDFELAAGFLHSEAILPSAKALWRIDYCDDADEESAGNVVEVHLRPGVAFDAETMTRHVFTSSSCGVCGKASIEAVRVACQRSPRGALTMDPELLLGLPAHLSAAQPVFTRTGGLHAAALFDTGGELLLLREDVGRHNAVDKLVGSLLLDDRLPASERILLVSGRASFELVQKALLAGIPTLAAVGAPSSLAVELAGEYNMTLIGFLRHGRFNVYSGLERLATS